MKSIGLALLLSGCATLPTTIPEHLQEAIYNHVERSSESISHSNILKQESKRVYFNLRKGCGMVQASQVEGTHFLFVDICVNNQGTTFGYSNFSSDVPSWIA